MIALVGPLRSKVFGPAGPTPPEVDVTRLDPAIADRIHQARNDVLDDRSSVSAWGHLGMVYLAHNINPQAIICLEQAQELDPNDARWPYLLGVLTYMSNQDRAIELFERAAKLAGDKYPSARTRLADAYLNVGRSADAAQILDGLIQARPNDARALRLRGQVALSQGDAELARDSLERSLAADASSQAVHLLLAQAYQRLNQPEKAARVTAASASKPAAAYDVDEILDEAHALRTGFDAWMQVAFGLMSRGQLDVAIGLLKAITTDYPNEWKGWAELGAAYRLAGNAAGASAAFGRALQLSPDDVDLMVAQSHELLRLGQVPAAEQRARQAVDGRPDDPTANLVLGNVLLAKRDYENSAVALRRAIDAKPDQPEALRGLAQAYVHLGRYKDALPVAREAQRMDSRNQAVHELILSIEQQLVASPATSPAIAPPP